VSLQGLVVVGVAKDFMLTTVDNPFDPFRQFESWQRFDENKGYFTCSYLARIAMASDELSDPDEALAIESAIDEIVRLNVLGLYRKVYEEGAV